VSWVRLLADILRSKIATFLIGVGAGPPPRVQTTSAPATARPAPAPTPAPPGARPGPPPPGLTPLPGEVLYYRELTPTCTEICYKDGNVNWVGDCVPYPLVDMARTGEIDQSHRACEEAAGVRAS